MTLEQKILLVERKNVTPTIYKQTFKKEKIDLKRVLTPSQYKSFLQKSKNL